MQNVVQKQLVIFIRESRLYFVNVNFVGVAIEISGVRYLKTLNSKESSLLGRHVNIGQYWPCMQDNLADK
jgi:hypothetical protein